MRLDTTSPSSSTALACQLTLVSDQCLACNLCVKQCSFLQEHGNPQEIAQAYPRKDESPAFECSLCHLCTAVCPVDIDPARMFLEMRREEVHQERGVYPAHQAIRSYEKRGFSPRFSYYGLPGNCDTIFFPGCALPGTRPDKVIKLFRHLQQSINGLGIVLDCCTKPSHDLGDQKLFAAMFNDLQQFLLDHQVSKVIVACTNCYKVFKEYGSGLTVTTAYEELDKDFSVAVIGDTAPVTVHDPCAVRFEEPIHQAVRSLIGKAGLPVEEMRHSHQNTICCGEGGSVGFLKADMAKNWSRMRKEEADGRTILTYCAGCANYLSRQTPTYHLLDLLFEPEATMAGKARVSRSPMTYLNRLKLKKYFRKNLEATTSRERPQGLLDQEKKGGKLKRLGMLAMLMAAIIAVRVMDLDRFLDQQRLPQLVQSYGALGPLVFMTLYAIAPSLFLPGLPFAVAAGVLFGPFWGVVYAIIGATTGATFAFLIGRYAGRQSLESKLSSPKWQQLDHDVEQHGWKMVAFTRLIPLFPFNLLNYAFGLTKIKLLHYIAASFFFMLPGCIAFVLLSSSLIEVLKGSISPTFIAGVLAVAVVSAIPLIYRKLKQTGKQM
ncbi:MAG: VTT domain-containing protein [Thermodesulfobacteriota bacterium]